MDDTPKHFTIQIKGTAYRFQPLPPEDIEMVSVVVNMNVAPLKAFKALSRVLSASAGPEQWDALTDRLIQGEVELTEISVDLFKRILTRQLKDRAKGQQEGLDVAGTLPGAQ